MRVLHQKVNETRITRRIEQLAKCTTTDRGVTRLSFTKESEMANGLVAQWMQEAGMTVRRDELNNIIGLYKGKCPNAPVMLIGSHLDSVVEGGKYDGILGVIVGIEVIQTMNENAYISDHPIEVIGFCDEEGTRFHTTLLGSRAIAGKLHENDFLAQDEQGVTLSTALTEVGLDPYQFQLAARDPRTILGYLELHIEQGPVLEQMNQACGAVSGIAGQTRYEFRVEGMAGHAGTVPIPLRKDALAGASEMIQAIERFALKHENVVATVGKLSVIPGASNVIPGLVEGTLDIRSINNEIRKDVLGNIMDECHRISKKRGLRCTFNKIIEFPAVPCSPKIIDVITSVIVEHQMKPVQLVSGAGHDAMAIASLTDIGMIFVRCKNGLSHHPDEHTSVEDMKQGASVLLDVVLRLTT